jgi:AraC-like DNA-binding protein
MDKQANLCIIRSMLESMQHLISERVSEIFDLYTALHGTRISLFSPQGRLLYPDLQGRPDCQHCQLLRKSLQMNEHCRRQDKEMMQQAAELQQMISYTCHAGMREAVIPLFVDKQLAGYVMVGQFRSHTDPAESPYATQWRNRKGNNALQDAFDASPVFPEDKIDTLLAMFRQLVELILSSQLIHHKDYDLIEPLIHQIRETPHINISMDEAAQRSGCSPSTVSRLFRKITGQSLKQYQIMVRLQLASERMLDSPSRPISEIASTVGFDDPFYFSRLFRKHYGISPSKYRNKSSKINGSD